MESEALLKGMAELATCVEEPWSKGLYIFCVIHFANEQPEQIKIYKKDYFPHLPLNLSSIGVVNALDTNLYKAKCDFITSWLHTNHLSLSRFSFSSQI